TTWRLPNADSPSLTLGMRAIMPLLRRGGDCRRPPFVAIGVEIYQAMVNGLGDFLAISAGRHERAILVVAEVADLEEKAGGNEVVADHRGNAFPSLAHDAVAN